MRKDRLLKLAEYLETKVPDYCWDYGVVWHNLGEGPPRIDRGGRDWERWKQNVIDQRDCGSVGCALGHASVLFPDFDRFTIETDFFGITEVESKAIFFGCGYGLDLGTSTRLDVAAAIRQFVADKE